MTRICVVDWNLLAGILKSHEVAEQGVAEESRGSSQTLLYPVTTGLSTALN